MKELESTIHKNGFEYTQVIHSKAGYVYAQTCKHSKRVVAYEVFKRKEKKPHVWGEIEYPAAVAFPVNESFGVWAWTYSDLRRALAKLRELEIDRPLKLPVSHA
jgi:hypothetical protein